MAKMDDGLALVTLDMYSSMIWPHGEESFAKDMGWELLPEEEEDVNDPISDEEISKLCHEARQGEWYPYPTCRVSLHDVVAYGHFDILKAFLTDILFNSPQLHFSRAQKRAILAWEKDLGTQLLIETRNPVTKKSTCLGNIFYLNEIGAALAKDMSNPLMCPHLIFYPEDAGNTSSQARHGGKPDGVLMPMVKHGRTQRHFYINELAECVDGTYFIPERWFLKKGVGMWARGQQIIQSSEGLTVGSGQMEQAFKDFARNYEEICVALGKKPIFTDEFATHANRMPHSLRETVQGRPVYSCPVIVFIDDASANISKQWNKHYCVYMSNGALPRELIDQEFNILFVATLLSVSTSELMQGVKESLHDVSADGLPAYDCMEEEECLLLTFPLFMPGDNPMQVEECSHMGLTANKFCWTCTVGGLQTGGLRTVESTLEDIRKQLARSVMPNARTPIVALIRDSGSKDAIVNTITNELVALGYKLQKKIRECSQRGGAREACPGHRVAKASRGWDACQSVVRRQG
ncbi:hypothetical protein K439DRAFT_1623235 [Ramaria rubella]|nr:hypothetical protein K439DRAFT_1623235 [Ramaria rubella]